MKLEGSLDAFGLPDIFQLLSFTKKTGGLHLRNGTVDGVVYFASGLVTGAAADAARQALARRLVGTGAVDDDSLRSAIAAALDHGRGVAHELLAAGSIDGDKLKEAASDQVVDAVFDLLRWPAGDFAFSLDESNPDDVGIELASDHVVREALSRREAFEALAAVIPSQESVLRLVALPSAEPTLSLEEWALVALVDGRRSVAEIADLSGLGQFAVLSAVAELIGRGLLAVSDDNDDHLSVVARRLALLVPLEGGLPTALREDEGDDQVVKPAVSAVAAESAVDGSVDESAAQDQVDDTADEASALRDEQPAQMPDDHTDELGEDSTHEDTSDAAGEDEDVDGEDEDVEDVDGVDDGEAVETTVGGPHVPQDVVPPRPEPFLPKRQPEHPEQPPVTTIHLGLAPEPASSASSAESVEAPAMVAPARPEARSVFAAAGPLHGGPSNGVPGGLAGGMTGGHPGSAASGSSGPTMVGGTNGSAAMAADPAVAALIERDPSVNRSLLLRLIAGVRGL